MVAYRLSTIVHAGSTGYPFLRSEPSYTGNCAGSRVRPLDSPSNFLAGCESRCPRPLEIESAELSGDVNHFSDKKHPRHPSAFHGLGGEFVGIHTAGCDLSLAKTFCSIGYNI